MKLGKRILVVSLIVMLILAACTPAPAPTPTQTQTPVPPTITEAPPTPTDMPTPTLQPEKNISYKKPVRVSASWVVDPPERAVNGNVNDWWGAGGPPPAWIEVDLEGLYSISRIQVINEGPTGMATYHVLGRSPGNAYQLLHVFEGMKLNNQTLEFSPEKPWEDISAIRVEILNGLGWAGFREVRVYSREEAKPLPASAELQGPMFLTRVNPNALEPITPDNAFLMRPLSMLGRGPVNELAWSPDGSMLAAASSLGVWLYDPAASDAAPRLLEGHTRDVLSVAFSQDGTTVFSGSQDGTVKTWDAATSALKHTFSLWDDFSFEVGKGNRNLEVWSIAFSPDRKLLAAGSLDGTLRLWSLTTSRARGVLQGHKNQITNLAFSPDGKLLASSDLDGAIFVWDLETRSQRAALSSQGRVQSLVFSPNGKLLAYGGSGMAVHVWDTVNGEEIAELAEHTGVLSLAFSPDSLTLASSGLVGTVQIWEVTSGSSRVFREGAGWIMNMAYSPDGSTLATYTWDGALRLWDVATASHGGNLAVHTSPVTSLAFSPDGALLVTSGEDGGVRLWEVKTNTLRATLWGHVTRVFGVAFSPDGTMVASASYDKTLILWDVASGRQVRVLSGHENFVRCVAFSPDGQLVASGSTDKTIRLWDTETGEERAVLTGHDGEVESVAFSSDGKWLVSASADKTLRIWNVASAKEIGILNGHLSFVLGAAFSPDGASIASVGGDHSLRAWNLASTFGVVTGRNRFAPIGHPGWVSSVAYSSDGAIIASANISTVGFWTSPGEVHLYSAESGFPYALLRGHTKRVTSIAFSPDGKLLASGSADGSVRLWGVMEKISQSTTLPTVRATEPAPSTVAEDLFSGDWTAHDAHDGSSMTLSIAWEGDHYYIIQVDDGASICGKDSAGRPKFGITLEYTGKTDGNALNAMMTTATCMSAQPTELTLNLSTIFTYDAATDTLLDALGQATWKRR